MKPPWTEKPLCKKCGGFVMKEAQGWNDVELYCLNCGLVYYPSTYGWQAPWHPRFYIPAVQEPKEKVA